MPALHFLHQVQDLHITTEACIMTTLRDLRAQLGMTQQQLADALGVGLRTMKGYESADDAPRMAVLACERLLSLQGTPMADPSSADDADRRAIEDKLAELGARADQAAKDMRTLNRNQLELCDMIPEGLAARLNAIEAKLANLHPIRPGVPTTEELKERAARQLDADHAAMLARSAAKRAELEAQEADDVPVDQPWNTYRPPQLTPEQEAAKKAARAAAKAAHLANGEPWD